MPRFIQKYLVTFSQYFLVFTHFFSAVFNQAKSVPRLPSAFKVSLYFLKILNCSSKTYLRAKLNWLVISMASDRLLLPDVKVVV